MKFYAEKERSSNYAGCQTNTTERTIYGESLDGTDSQTPLHDLMAAHISNPDDWQEEYCQLVEEA